MPTVRLFALIFLITGRSLSQDHMLNRTPNEMRAEIDSSGGFTPSFSRSSPVPPAPAAHRVIDKKFMIVMGALGGAESLRYTSRKLVLDNEFAAGAPWVTTVPPNQHLVAKYAGLYVAELLVAYEVKKPHSWLPGDKAVRKLWWAYPATVAAIHIKNGVGNIRTQGPGGCTSIECAEQMQ
ncbi:MAG: hypothetical protein WBC78_02125 [Candidatus Sulfotelmatobacter sp.]